MEKKKYRILKNKLGEYKPQVWDYIFWSDLRDHGGYGNPAIFETRKEAEEFAKAFLERKRLEKLRNQWGVLSKLKDNK